MGTSFCVPSGKWSGAAIAAGGVMNWLSDDPRNPLTRLWQAATTAQIIMVLFHNSLTDFSGKSLRCA